MPATRDTHASIKLIGAVLRLQEFTVQELAEFAGVKLETARAFLKPGKGPGVAEAQYYGSVLNADKDDDGADISPNGARAGRPAKRYRLIPAKKELALKKLAKYRRSLEIALPETNRTADENAEDFAPLALLEACLEEFELGSIIERQDWTDAIEQARAYLEAAQADFDAMKPIQARRLGYAQAKLKYLELRGFRLHEEHDLPGTTTPRRPESTSDESRTYVGEHRFLIDGRGRVRAIGERDTPKVSRISDRLDHFVNQHCQWAGETDDGMFVPKVLFLACVDDTDKISDRLIDLWKQKHARVAIIKLTEFADKHRFEFYRAIDRLRATTPWASAEVVVMTDSRDAYGRKLAKEVKRLCTLGEWHSGKKMDGWDFPPAFGATMDDQAVRLYFVKQAMNLRVTSYAQQLYANRVISALSMVTASVAQAAAESLSVSPTNVRTAPTAPPAQPVKPADFGLLHPAEPSSWAKPSNLPKQQTAEATLSVDLTKSSRMAKVMPALMGPVVCYDIHHDLSMEREWSGDAVKYVPNALQQLAYNDRSF